MATNKEHKEMLANMMNTFGGFAEQQRRDMNSKDAGKKESPKEVFKKVEEKPAKEEPVKVKKEEQKAVEAMKEEKKPKLETEPKAEPMVKESKKAVSLDKKKKTVKEILLAIVAKGYDLNESDEKKKQTSIYLSEEAIDALDKAYLELSKSVKIKKSDIMAMLVKDFVNVYEGKSQEVFEIALNYNDKDLKKKITNWTPSKEMKEELEMVIDKYGLKRLKMKYNMACDMILLHYLK